MENAELKFRNFDIPNSGLKTDDINFISAILDYFELFFSPDLVGFITDKTNNNWTHIRQSDPKSADKYPLWLTARLFPAPYTSQKIKRQSGLRKCVVCTKNGVTRQSHYPFSCVVSGLFELISLCLKSSTTATSDMCPVPVTIGSFGDTSSVAFILWVPSGFCFSASEVLLRVMYLGSFSEFSVVRYAIILCMFLWLISWCCSLILSTSNSIIQKGFR
ncbi:hypothetical protein M0802_012663 [Mischocyttarus mexicanus]|nr:hypothetical protein M0802_012663 [Mischocyttarus mexicanus]